MEKKISKVFVVLGILFLLIGANSILITAQKFEKNPIEPVIQNLSSWIPVYFDFPNTVEEKGHWYHPGYHAAQWNNCDPCFLLHPAKSLKWTVKCQFWINSTHDDDFIGFTFGHHDLYHFCTFDWLANWKGENGYNGFTVREFYTTDLGNYWMGDFKSEVSTPPEMTIIDDLHQVPGDNNSYSWKYFLWYDFHMIYDSGTYTITIFNGTHQLWTSTDTITHLGNQPCHFGFYDCSLKGAEFRQVEISPTLCRTTPNVDNEAQIISSHMVNLRRVEAFPIFNLFMSILPSTTPLYRLLNTLLIE
jgi:hypothetical protein